MSAAATTTLDAWRVNAAVEAGLEVSAIAAALQRNWDDTDATLLRGMAIRLEHLASVVLSALEDSGATEADVCERLLGPEHGRSRIVKRRAEGEELGPTTAPEEPRPLRLVSPE